MGLSRGEAPRDRSCARRERWDRRSFRAVARGGIRVSTFQCSLRPDPAAAGNHQTLSRSLEGFGWRTIGGGLGYGKPRAARNRSWLAETRLDSPIDQPNVIRMETVTISPKFQIVIPQRIRESMGLRSGEKAHVLAFRNRIEVIPIRDMRALRGYFKGIDTSVVREGDRV